MRSATKSHVISDGFKWSANCERVNPFSYNHTKRQTLRQASAASEASDLCNGSGTHLEHQVKHHHRLALVALPLPLTLILDAPLDTRCGYTLNLIVMRTSVKHKITMISDPNKVKCADITDQIRRTGLDS